jgi:hypothetical protein
LGLLQKAGLQIKTQKCEFHKITIEYLGILVTSGGPRIDPIEVIAVE